MICPNCSSSRLRRSKRSTAEKIFLPMLLTRPFRCEDCIARFFGWLWRSTPSLAASDSDMGSLVSQSPTAALHSREYQRRGRRRKTSDVLSLNNLPAFFSRSIKSWLNEPMQHPKRHDAYAPVDPPGETPKPRAEFFPEVLGVILEIKHEDSLG